MSQNYDVINPERIATEASDDEYESPADRVRDVLSEQLDRDFGVADDDHPLLLTAGSKEDLKSNTPEDLQKRLSDDLYEDPGVFWREWKQNHVSACIREGRRRVKNEHGIDALYRQFEHDHEALDEPRQIQLPKSPADILSMARDLGYVPTVEFEINHETQKIVCRDNGIGMTTGEAIGQWKEPGESSSGSDFSSAGRMGVGAMTWISIAGYEAGISVKTRTRRNETVLNADPVPDHDRRGYEFYSYLGGIEPTPGKMDDDFYGTEFHIPVQDSIDMSNMYGHLQSYMELCPVKILWTETDSTGTIREEEFAPTTFFDQYSHAERDAPAITVDRPGEFSVAMDQPDVVSKGYNDEDTWLIDMPINRNTKHHQGLDTLYNDHIHLHNEQGLIVAGPNRGLREGDVDELHEDDVPLPTPTMDRDRLSRGEAHERFFEHLNTVAVEREQEHISDVVNDFFACDDIYAAMEHVGNHTQDFELALKFLKKHYSTHSRPKKLLEELAADVNFDIDDDEVVSKAIKNEGYQSTNYSPSSTSPPELKHESHPKWDLVQLFCDLQDSVSYATKGTVNPNKMSNRGNKQMFYLLDDTDKIFVAKQISDDRATVAWNTHPDALVLKVDSYGRWMDEPFNATKLKTVSFKRSADNADDYDIPDDVHGRHSYDGVRSADADDGSESKIRLRRDAENTAVDSRRTLDDLTDALEQTAFGDPITSDDGHKLAATSERRGVDHERGHRYMVVFPTSRTGRNISEHYSWQTHAVLARATVTECERLLEYPQVFKPDDFESFVADQTYGVVNPFDDTHEYVTATELFESDIRTILLDKTADRVINTLYGGWPGDAVPDESAERLRTARRNYVDQLVDEWGSGSTTFKNPLNPRFVCSGCGDGFDSKQGRSLHQNYCARVADDHEEADPEEWRFATISTKQAKLLRAHVHLNIGEDFTGQTAADATVMLGTDGGNVYYLLAYSSGLSDQGARYATKWLSRNLRVPSKSLMEKCMWADVWPVDDDVWGRANSNYHGLKSHEKVIYRWARDHGINPYDFRHDDRSSETIHYALDAICGDT